MDWFNPCLSLCTIALQGALQLTFACRLTGKRAGGRHFAVYLPVLFALDALLSALPPGSAAWTMSGVLAYSAAAAVLYAIVRRAFNVPRAAAGTAALLAVYLPLLAFGMVNSLEILLIPPALHGTALYVLLVLATLLAFALCGGGYLLILRSFPLLDGAAPDLALLLFPSLFFLSAQLYIMQTAYTFPPDAAPPVQGAQLLLLLLQALGLAALLCTLYACRRACRALQDRQRAASLAQAVQAQKAYLDQAQRRYTQTQAFRHDVKNHLTVLDGLLRRGDTDAARSYLQTLQAMTAALSFPYRTGRPVVDILLAEKLDGARTDGVQTDAAVRFPDGWDVDDLDLCVIFSNALDNAIAACRPVKDAPAIRIRCETQGDFFLLQFENTCLPGPLPPMGTGLSNIKAAAEQYGGTILAEKDAGRFRLHVLLNRSRQGGDRSGQKPCNPAGTR